MPEVSLNHNINFGLSSGSGVVMSHGKSTSLLFTAQITRNGTVAHNVFNKENTKNVDSNHNDKLTYSIDFYSANGFNHNFNSSKMLEIRNILLTIPLEIG